MEPLAPSRSRLPPTRPRTSPSTRSTSRSPSSPTASRSASGSPACPRPSPRRWPGSPPRGRQRRAPVRRRALVERRDVHGRAAWLRKRQPNPNLRRDGRSSGPSPRRSARHRQAPPSPFPPPRTGRRPRRAPPRADRPASAGASRRGRGASCSAGRWRATRSRPSGLEDEGARGLLERQPLVGAYATGGDPHAARGRPGRVLADAADLARHRRDPRHHRRLVPPDDRGYPNGGGSYIVARGQPRRAGWPHPPPRLPADYVLAVSVSVAAGIAAITSAFPGLLADLPRRGWRPRPIVLVMLVNLARHPRERHDSRSPRTSSSCRCWR
jgi:hypothetical protein